MILFLIKLEAPSTSTQATRLRSSCEVSTYYPKPGPDAFFLAGEIEPSCNSDSVTETPVDLWICVWCRKFARNFGAIKFEK